jgi:type II secretory pathway pseudopilin PulG
MKNQRGFTLVEVMLAVGLSMLAMTVVMILVLFTTAKARDSDVVADSNSYARLGGDAIASALRLAGMGSGQGVYLNSAGAPLLANAVYGRDNLTINQAGNAVTGTDDLWIIAPVRNGMLDNCNVRGAYTILTAAGTGPLAVKPVAGPPCTQSFVNGDTLLVTNLNGAALISSIVLNNPGINQINYSESAIPGFSNAPQRGGFQQGDLAVLANVVHYYLDRDPTTNQLALYSKRGTVGADFLGRPLVDTGTATLVQRYIEDLQVVYWLDPNQTNDPAQYVDQHGLAPAYQTGVKAVTLYLVARTQATLKDANNGVILSNLTAPKSVANHAVAGTPDGLRRSIYSRRIELPNLTASSI